MSKSIKVRMTVVTSDTSNESVGLQKRTSASWSSVQLIRASFCAYYFLGNSLLVGVSMRNGISQ